MSWKIISKEQESKLKGLTPTINLRMIIEIEEHELMAEKYKLFVKFMDWFYNDFSNKITWINLFS